MEVNHNQDPKNFLQTMYCFSNYIWEDNTHLPYTRIYPYSAKTTVQPKYTNFRYFFFFPLSEGTFPLFSPPRPKNTIPLGYFAKSSILPKHPFTPVATAVSKYL